MFCVSCICLYFMFFVFCCLLLFVLGGVVLFSVRVLNCCGVGTCGVVLWWVFVFS